MKRIAFAFAFLLCGGLTHVLSQETGGAEEPDIALLGCHFELLLQAKERLVLPEQQDLAGYDEVARRAWSALLDGDFDRCYAVLVRFQWWVAKGYRKPSSREDLISAGRAVRLNWLLDRCVRSHRLQNHFEDRFGPDPIKLKSPECEALPSDRWRADAVNQAKQLDAIAVEKAERDREIAKSRK